VDPLVEAGLPPQQRPHRAPVAQSGLAFGGEEAVAFEVVVFSEAADGQFEAGPRRRNAPQLRFFLATHTQV